MDIDIDGLKTGIAFDIAFNLRVPEKKRLNLIKLL